MGDKLAETVMRLDLRDPANLAFARSLLHVPFPWPSGLADDYRRLTERIASHGTVERTVSSVQDDSQQLSSGPGRSSGDLQADRRAPHARGRERAGGRLRAAAARL